MCSSHLIIAIKVMFSYKIMKNAFDESAEQ